MLQNPGKRVADLAKVSIIGFDGGTFKIIDYLIKKGRLPNFTRVLDEGTRATLMSTIPPLTPAAWPSFYTGTNPGKTGVVDFFSFRQDTYKLTPVNAVSVKSEPVWKYASRYGKRVCVYNVPVTYPASEINGILISGLEAPSLDERAIYPKDFKDQLLSAIPDFAINPVMETKNLVDFSEDPVGEFIKRLRDYNEMQLRTIRYLMDLEDWDLFISVIRAPDTLQHTFWRDAEILMREETAPEEVTRRGESIFACYESLDSELGKSWLRHGTDRNMIFMSDHGFGELGYEVCLNRVLADSGLLSFKEANAQDDGMPTRLFSRLPAKMKYRLRRLLGRNFARKRYLLTVDNLLADIDWSRTSIFAAPWFGCLHVNLRGRFPLGIISDGEERENVIRKAEAALSSLIDSEDGRPVFTAIHRGEKIFIGHDIQTMPDLVPEMRSFSYRAVPGTRMELNGEAVIRPHREDWKQLAHTGCHRLEGMLIMHGIDVEKADLGSANITDIVPTVVSLLGLPAQDNIDGRVIEEAVGGRLTPVAVDEKSTFSGTEEKDDNLFSTEEEDEVRRRLEDLGYL